MQNDMNKREFELFSTLVYERLGISLSDQKISLLQNRLGKLMHQKNMDNYRELYNYFIDHEGESADNELEDAVTTNVTSFFRHEEQWSYLKEYLLQHASKNKDKKLRIWSAACSSGEEPYSMAMMLKEHLNDFDTWDIKILATDISEEILRHAIQGSYKGDTMEGISDYLLNRYFSPEEDRYRIDEDLRSLVTFRKFNLVYGDYSLFSHPFDLILCRNVMIYFDRNVQTQINTNLARILRSGGLLLVGHSETIPAHVGGLKLIKSSIYTKH
ncbi:protein-glutamate O-methyltransferase CheR [Sulfuricurvum sp.]|uniref:CheR family methyltransferase n=1 Tax=Sulfuricurvum sp. TaxID=2025608 RepID=UPI002E37036C|nr:protein-glutamate O-methyltransferase CheR [Sulfuricurvum sp.]HEX5330945.1 protein-glutamate O-methyltransferase CheR [Sulfuricurvum sp.]